MARSIINTTKKAREDKLSGWMNPQSSGVGTIFFDFESIGFPPNSKHGKLRDIQDPYEIGMSIWSKTEKKWVHKRFQFSPPGLSDKLNKTKTVAKNGVLTEAWLDRYTGYAAKTRGEHYHGEEGFREKLFKGNEPIDWKGIDKFLTDHGYDKDSKPHFATHNGVQFDYPLMDKLLEQQGSDSLFGKLYSDAPAHGNEEGLTVRRQDSLVAMQQLYSDTGVYVTAKSVNEDGSFKATKVHKNDYMYHPHEAMDVDGGTQTGTGMDGFRKGLLKAYTGTGDLSLINMFNDPDQRKALYKDLDMTDQMEPWLRPDDNKAEFEAFLKLAGHSGVADTAIGVLSLLPMMHKHINTDWSDPDAVAEVHQAFPVFVNKDGSSIEPRDLYNRHVAPNSNIKYEDDALGGAAMLKRAKATTEKNRAEKKRRAQAKAEKQQGLQPEQQQGKLEEPTYDDPFEEVEAEFAQEPEVKEFVENVSAENEALQVESPEDFDDDEWSPDPVASFLQEVNKIDKASFHPELHDLIGDNDIDVVKWQGGDSLSDTSDGRLVVMVPIGNTRVPFRATMMDAEGNPTNKITGFSPFLGAGLVNAPDGSGVWQMGVSDYIGQLFGNRYGSGPLGRLGALISASLTENLDKLQAYTEGMPILNHTELNKRINTPASHWLNKSIDTPLDRDEIMPEAKQDYQNAAKEAFRPFMGDNGKYDMSFADMVGPISVALSDPLRGPDVFEGLDMFDPDTGKINEDWLKSPDQMRRMATMFRDAGIDATPTLTTPANGELFSYDNDKPSTVDANYVELAQAYFRGEMPDGIHPKQFVNDPGGEDVSAFDQLMQYIMLRHRVDNLGEAPLDVINDMGFVNPLNVDSTKPVPDLDNVLHDASNPEKELTDQIVASSEYVANADATQAPPEVASKVTDDAFETSQARFSLGAWFDHMRATTPNTPGFNDSQYNEVVTEFTELYSSPFTSWWNIEGSHVDFTDAKAVEQLFPDREVAQTTDQLKELINTALEEYSESPNGLLRELTWIKDNHEQWLTQEAMQESFANNDSKSVVGRWIDAVKVASNSGADFDYVEQERETMGDKFMNNAHREYIRQNPEESIPLVDNPPFEEPKAKVPKTLREKIRQMATGAWTSSGYYNMWRDIKNETSGKNAKGRKALKAAREGDLGGVVEQGITTQEQFMEHIGDLPVEGTEQRGILGVLLQGRKTFKDLAREQAQSGNKDRQKVLAETLRNLEQLQHDRIQHRVPDRDVTEADREASQAAAKAGLQAQANFRTQLREQGDASQRQRQAKRADTGAAKALSNLKNNAPTAKLDPDTAKDDFVDDTFSKSLDKLKEYLREV